MTRDAAPLEHVACALCGADDPEPLLWLDDLRFRTLRSPVQLVRCRRCDFRYLTPQPHPGDEAAFYPSDYDPFQRTSLTGRARRLLLRYEVRRLWSYLAPPRRILEVGCATGDLLHCIREAGNPRVYGLEPDPRAAETARSRGLAVWTGTLDTVPWIPASFDVVLFQHVLEHLPQPRDALSVVAEVLRPGGTVILWLPNGHAWAASLFGEAWMGYDPPRHRSVFTSATLRRLLAQAGFEVVAEHHEWHGLEWAWGLRLLARRIGADRLEKLLATGHLPLVLACTPLAALAALAHRSGRIRVIARKSPAPTERSGS